MLAILVVLAAVGPIMTEVAAEVGDGLIIHPFSNEKYIREVTLPAVERGLAKAGKEHSTAKAGKEHLTAKAGKEHSKGQISSACQYDLQFERACVLFNLAAALGYSATVQKRSDADGPRRACQRFQQAH